MAAAEHQHKKAKVEPEPDGGDKDLDRASPVKDLDIAVDEARIRKINEVQDLAGEEYGGVVYWMSRDQRVQDNWALLYAQELSLKYKLPLHVCFCLVPKFLDATERSYGFMLKGLREVEEELQALQIQFSLLMGDPAETLPAYVKEHRMRAVVVDFSPLRVPLNWVKSVGEKIAVPLYQVDAHNIVPCWHASNKLEYAARTIRPKLEMAMPHFLTDFPLVKQNPYATGPVVNNTDWKKADASLEIDRSVKEVSWAIPGTKAGLQVLSEFCSKRLSKFATLRNDPNESALSNLSPWLHFGQISSQRIVRTVMPFKSKHSESVKSFVEELFVRRELADNFCFYQPQYDSLNAANDWARLTLQDHIKDKREYEYTLAVLEKGKTHDDLWNAAQLQMVKEGKMHGFLRMYWAKKILEWTSAPALALKYAIFLNDKYSLDGRDPNGYVGCAWSICGIHDQGWGERAIFGKIRYMNYKGCQRKFDVARFVAKWLK